MQSCTTNQKEHSANNQPASIIPLHTLSLRSGRRIRGWWWRTTIRVQAKTHFPSWWKIDWALGNFIFKEYLIHLLWWSAYFHSSLVYGVLWGEKRLLWGSVEWMDGLVIWWKESFSQVKGEYILRYWSSHNGDQEWKFYDVWFGWKLDKSWPTIIWIFFE